MDKQTQALAIPDVDQTLLSEIINSPRAHQKDIPIELIIDLRKKQLSTGQIAKLVGCSRPNIVQRLQKAAVDIELTYKFRKHRGEILANLQRRIIQSITPADLEKAGLRDKVISSGILFDKERLEEGKSTSIVFYADLIKAKQIVDQQIQDAEQLDNMSSNEGKAGI